MRTGSLPGVLEVVPGLFDRGNSIKAATEANGQTALGKLKGMLYRATRRRGCHHFYRMDSYGNLNRVRQIGFRKRARIIGAVTYKRLGQWNQQLQHFRIVFVGHYAYAKHHAPPIVARCQLGAKSAHGMDIVSTIYKNIGAATKKLKATCP